MNKYLILSVLAAVTVSCSEEKLPSAPSVPGSDVIFNISLDEPSMSRTTYGDEANNAFPIYWVDKDQLLMASPECETGRNTAVYQVSVEGATSSTAKAVDKVGTTGLQWGDNLPAHFYSVYPVGYYTAANTEVKNRLENSTGGKAVAHLNVRDYQINLFEKDATGTWKGTPIDRKSMTNLDLNQKNPDALMYAMTRQTQDGNVTMQYHPFTTAFHIEFDGFDLTSSVGQGLSSVTVQEIMITAPSNVKLCGNFDATLDVTTGTPSYTVNTDVNTETNANVIHIPTLSSIDGHYLTVNSKEKVSLNVFAIPVDGNVTSDWTILVRTNEGAFKKALTPTTAASGGLVAGKMHKVSLPAIKIQGATKFDKAQWIAQIPRNVYVSELSMPGAWYATKGEYQGSDVTYESLWTAGVRAFALETRSSGAGPFSNPGTPAQVVISGTGNNQTLGSGYYGGTGINTVMTSLVNLLKNHPDEYAVLVLMYADGGSGGHRTQDYSYWLNGIYGEYMKVSAENREYIYSNAITPNTTINDVKGKLIIKVNAEGNLPGGNITIGSYANNLPALISYVDRKWETTSQNSSLVSQMYWQVWSGSYMTNLSSDVAALDPNTLYWNYTVANRTKTDASTATGLPSYANRQASISTILANSRTIYENSSHNVWFFVGAGGNQATSTNSDTDASTAQSFATTMNPWINTQIESKINGKDFSPFGIVMCNYITNATYHGPTIIDNIIKMNRLFRLNRDETQPEWPDSGTTPANSPANYSSSHTNGGDAWTVNQ